MQISKITSPISYGKHFINADIGASSINGSLKICAINDKDEIIAKDRLTVFDEGEERSENKFEENVAQKVAAFENKYKDKIAKHDKDNEVQLTVCYPGPPRQTVDNSTGFLISNFYYDNDRHERFKRPINPDKIDVLLIHKGINIIQSRHANDMAGAGACLLSKLEKSCPEVLEEGKEILYMYPGGGLGTGFIIVDKDNIKIRPSEIQHMLKQGTKHDSLENDAGAARLRHCFAEELELSPTEEAILGENTKAVTSFQETRKLFPHITRDKFQDASRETILNYMDSLAQLIATKVCETQLKTVVITGPIAKGIREAVNGNSSFIDYTSKFPKDENDNFTATLRRKIQKSLTPVGKKLLGNAEDLNILYLQIADNTDGAQILQKGVAVGQPPAWYNIYDK